MTWTPGSDAVRRHFLLDEGAAFLNHGSFGATPRGVLDAQTRLREAMEREPVQFLARRLPEAMAKARAALGAFVGADPAGLAFVPNATTAVNAVLGSLDWSPGDEVLCADQSYNAVVQSVRWRADRQGVVLKQAVLPFPVEDPAAITAAFAAAITPRTKLLLVDHVSSPTALVLPVAELVALARKHGILILVDGAHAPGQLPLALDALGADFYTGNLHKWCFAAKGAALLHVAEPWRDRIHPVTISHGYGFGLHAEFDWVGTIDPTAWLTVPEALEFHAAWPGIAEALHRQVQDWRVRLADALGVTLPHPDDGRLYAAMAAVPWPEPFDGDFAALSGRSARLYADHRIEVPFFGFDDRTWMRVSAQIYTRESDIARLVEVLRAGWR